MPDSSQCCDKNEHFFQGTFFKDYYWLFSHIIPFSVAIAYSFEDQPFLFMIQINKTIDIARKECLSIILKNLLISSSFNYLMS